MNKSKRLYARSTAAYLIAFILNGVLLALISSARPALAVGFDNVLMRHSRMTKSHVASGTDPILVIVNPATVGTELSLGISFASNYVIGLPAAVTVSTASLPATVMGLSITAAPGIGSAATAVSGQNVTFSLTDLNIANTYGFYITGGVTSPTTVGQKLNRISTHTDATPDFSGYTDAIDNTRVAVYIVDDATTPDEDQIVVTARVSPIYTFILANNSITLDAALATVEYPGAAGANSGVSPATITVTTNAGNGHAMWLKSGTASGLTSATVAQSIAFSGTAADATPSTLSAGTEGVVVDVDETTDVPGTMTIAAEFLGASTSAGGTPSTTFQEIATATGPVGGAGHVVTVIPRVAIAATTQAADDYTQTFTVIGASNF